MCFVFISEQTATCVTYSINWLVFITEIKSVYCAVRTGSLNKAVCPSSLKGSFYPQPRQLNQHSDLRRAGLSRVRQILRTRPDRPSRPTMRTVPELLPGGKAAGVWQWPPSSVEVKQRVQLYMYLPYVPSWHVVGLWGDLLPLPTTFHLHHSLLSRPFT